MDITAPIRPPSDKRRGRRKNFVLRFIGFLFAAGMIVFVIGAGAVAAVLWKMSQDLPNYEALANYEPEVTTRIHANDGSLIAEYSRQRRIFVPINAVPEKVIHAFISAEDKNFYQHGGLDIQGIIRALATNLTNIQSGRRLVGASTITQQVAKNFLLTNVVSYDRKIKEAILAIRIERAFTKDQILELYLNEIYLGRGAYGVAAAALTYWDKSLNELTLADVAYLASLPKGPSNYDPFTHADRAIARRNWVIDRMVENGYATPEEGVEAKASPLGVTRRKSGPRIYASEYFAEEVRRDVQDLFGTDKLYGGGLSVRTTLDPELQRYAHEALVDGLVAYDHRHGWRGVKDHIAVEGDWGKTLAAMDVWNDIDPWRIAVVLKADAKEAVIGLRPTTDEYGKLRSERETGTIAYSEVKWARPVLKNGLGGTPKTVSEVLKPGDVIYVSPVTKDDGKGGHRQIVKGEWSLQQVPKIGGAIVAMDPYTGRVLALSGGFSFDESQFDRAIQARRQPGSSFKPFIYSTAMDNGYTPASIIYDGPITIDQGPGLPPWQPKNYEAGSAAGPSTLRYGIEHSRNLMTVRLSRDMGMPIICEYARRFGVYDDLMPVLSMSLGAGETTLMRLVTGYSMFANGGLQIKSTLIDRIQDRHGRTIWRHDTRECPNCAAKAWRNQPEPQVVENRKHVLDPMTAYQITSLLEGVVERGTGRRVSALGRPVAGKTGTTNDEKDGWFIGFTPNLAVGVFMGFDNPKPMGHGETGGHVAAPVFLDFMQLALADKPPVPFRKPPGIKLVRVDLKTGLPAYSGDQKTIMEAFKPGEEPMGAMASTTPSYPPQDGYGQPAPSYGGGGGGYGGQPYGGGGQYGGGQYGGGGYGAPPPQPQPQQMPPQAMEPPRPSEPIFGGRRRSLDSGTGGLY